MEIQTLIAALVIIVIFGVLAFLADKHLTEQRKVFVQLMSMLYHAVPAADQQLIKVSADLLNQVNTDVQSVVNPTPPAIPPAA